MSEARATDDAMRCDDWAFEGLVLVLGTPSDRR